MHNALHTYNVHCIRMGRKNLYSHHWDSGVQPVKSRLPTQFGITHWELQPPTWKEPLVSHCILKSDAEEKKTDLQADVLPLGEWLICGVSGCFCTRQHGHKGDKENCDLRGPFWHGLCNKDNNTIVIVYTLWDYDKVYNIIIVCNKQLMWSKFDITFAQNCC